MRYLLPILLLYTSLLQAQPGKPDSILKALAGMKPGTAAYNQVQNDLAVAYWKQGNDSLARTLLERNIASSKQSGFYEAEAKARSQWVRMEMEHMEQVGQMHQHIDTLMMLANRHNDAWIEAIACFRKAQVYGMGFYEYKDTIPKLFERARQLFAETGDKTMEGSVYAELASLEAEEGRFAAAVDYLQKARKLQESTGNKEALRATLPNLGAMYASLEMYDEALQIFELAAQNAKDLDDERVLAYVAYQKGDIFKKRRQYIQAQAQYQQAAAIYQRAGAIQLLTNLYARMADLLLLQQKLDSALLINKYADSLYFAHVDIEESFFHYTNSNFAKIYLAKKNYPQAIFYAQMGIDTLQKAETVLATELRAYYEVLATAFEQTGNYAAALKNYKQFKAWSDTITNDDATQRALTANLTYQFEKKQQAADLALQKAEQKRLVQARNFLIALLALALALAAVVLHNNRKLRLKNQQLVEKNAEIAKALDRGQRLERRRIATELHDNLNTQLAAIKWYLEAMDTQPMPEGTKVLHGKLVHMAEALYKDLRLISHLLLPGALEKEGLQGALQSMIEKVNQSSNTRFTLACTPMEHLDEHRSHQLYNIALELINNVIKHAKATQATLTLRENETESAIMVEMEDNGKGIDASLLDKGIGLQNMAYRASSLGGSLQYRNLPQGGAKVTVQVPL